MLDACRVIELPKIGDPRGNLTYVEGGRHVPFDIKRVYYLYDVPGGADRGGHSHRHLQQLLIAMSGSFDVVLSDGYRTKTQHLNRSYYGLYIPSMVWRELENFSSGSVCLVLASAPYDEADYFRDYQKFLGGGEGRGVIPFLDVGASYNELRADLDAAYRRVMDAGWFILGREVAAFETEFAEYCGTAHCITVGNGLDALLMALKAFEIGRGDEVIVPANTFIATWLAVTHAGATPVPVEPDPMTHNLDPSRLEAAVTPRTKAVIPVHLYGQPADMDPIRAVAHRHDSRLIEDAAQAHGARYQGGMTGSLGDCGCFSFYPGKNLGCFGDGGAITTDDTALADRLRLLRNYGSERKYQHETAGINSRLDELQAAFLRVKLRHLDEWNDRRRRLAARYVDLLTAVPGIAFSHVPAGVEPVWHLFVVCHPRRNELLDYLKAVGIGAQVHYPVPPHRSDVYAGSGWLGPLPIAERLAANVISLPIGPHLTESQVSEVCSAVRDFRALVSRAA